MNLRLKRLNNDYSLLLQYLYENPYISLKNAAGDPPEKYHLEYHLKSLRVKENNLILSDSHQVEITMPMEYPSIQPQCRMLTPVFHPNIAPHAICIADFWAAGESLKDVVIRIGEMLCYQNYSVKSPLNGEAAKWAFENSHRLPLDTVDLRAYGSTQAVRPPEIIVNTSVNNYVDFPSSPVKSQDAVSCANCGTQTTEYVISTCGNNHILCKDCVVKCSKCGKEVCIICQMQKCIICGKILCSDCQDICSLCKKVVCSHHIKECAVCGRKFCANCMHLCPECDKYYCRLHFHEYDNKCGACGATPTAW